MWKSLALFAVLIIGAGGMAGQPNKAGNTDNHKSSKSDALTTPVNTYEANCCTTQTPQKSDNEPFEWHAAIKRPEWWLVIVGFITFGVVIWQAILMRQHAGHFKDLAEKLPKVPKRPKA